MRIVFSLLVTLLAVATINNAIADDQKPVADFTLVGVQLGDNGEQVIKGVAQYLSLSQDDLEISTDHSGETISKVEYKADDLRVRVYLSERVKNADGKEIRLVSSVSVDWAGTSDIADKIVGAIKKHSPPSSEFEGLWILCDTVAENKVDCGEGSDGINLLYSDAKGSVTMLSDFKK